MNRINIRTSIQFLVGIVIKLRLPKAIRHLLVHGNRYVPALLPDDLERLKFGHCYDNCAATALIHKGTSKYRYVEGIAIVPGKRPIPHAWLTDGVHAFDLTWFAHDGEGNERPMSVVTYIGIEMPINAVIDFMKATKYSGVFMNGWRDRIRFKKCLEV